MGPPGTLRIQSQFVAGRLTVRRWAGMMRNTMGTQPQENVSAGALHDVRQVIATEARALDALAARLDERVAEAVALMANGGGKIVVAGLGKCAYVAQKIAATLSSTGSPAVYLHPTESVHGDIGVVQPGDVALMLSNSGETDEMTALLPMFRDRGVPVVAFTGRPLSRLARRSDVALDTGVEEEGDPFNLAPMASTTAMLALGDAIAVALMRARGFTEQDYARLHPGGTLGQRLLCRVRDLMHTGDAIPALPARVSVRQAILEITAKRLGTVFLLDEEDRLTGILTDGDLRRLLQREPQPLEAPVHGIMTANPRTVRADALAIDALRTMEQDSPVTCLAVVDDATRLVGALHIHDLIRAGIA